MRTKLSCIAIIVFLIATSCNNSSDHTSASQPQADTPAPAKNPSPADSVQSEMVTLNSTKDYVKIKYHTNLDTLYGYTQGNNLVVEGDMLMKLPRKEAKGVATTFNLWPLNPKQILVIPYVIESGSFYPDRIMNAMDMWNRKSNNAIQFVKWAGQDDYIDFIPSVNTQSFVGKIGKKQTIEIAQWAREGNIAHELGHLFGLYHEQSRKDRDQYVQITCPDDVNYSHAFKDDPYARDLGEYNFFSIMHYPPTDCMKTRNQKLPLGIPGQRDSITQGDYNAVQTIYKLNQ